LLNRFQSDDLEARFGQYRQMGGPNYEYHISVIQVLDSERKLKIVSLLNLKLAKNDDFHLIVVYLQPNELSTLFLLDEPLKGSKSLKIFKISLTFRFDKL
jgi:hypothetical protein